MDYRKTTIPGWTAKKIRNGVYNYANYNQQLLTSMIIPTQTVQDVVSSANNKNYKWLMGHGRIVAGNYYRQLASRSTYSTTEWSIRYRYWDSRAWRYNYTDTWYAYDQWTFSSGMFPSAPVPPLADQVNAANSLVNAAFAEFYSSGMALVDIAEGHKTLSMIRARLHDAHALMKLELRHFRRGKVNDVGHLHELRYLPKRLRKKKKKLLKAGYDPGSLWLEWHYGWMPTMLSCRDYTKEYAAWLGNQKRFTVRKRQESTSSTFADRFYTSDWGTNCKTYGRARTTLSYTNKASVALIGQVLLHKHRGGLALQDIPSAAWELVPYSFVIDWFVNVGDVLKANMPKPSIPCIMSSLTVTTQNLRTKHEYASSHGYGRTDHGLGAWSTLEVDAFNTSHTYETGQTKTRTIGVGPTFQIDTSNLFNVKSLNHVISGCFLTSQRIKTGSRGYLKI